MIHPLPLFALPLALAACDGSGGPSISINTTASDDNVTAVVDGNAGDIAVGIPGFSGHLKMPKIKLDGVKFELNGVHLYPGSTISGMRVDGSGGTDSGNFRVDFDSPAAPETVQTWFFEKLSKEAGFKIRRNGTGLIGKTNEDKPFRLELRPNGAERAKGTIILAG